MATNTDLYDIRKIKWRSRRGMRELDRLCDSYLERHFALASLEERALYISLLEMQDPELYSLLMHRSPYPSAAMKALIIKINPNIDAY